MKNFNTKLLNHFLFSSLCFLLFSCARDRAVETIPDPENKIFSKASFVDVATMESNGKNTFLQSSTPWVGKVTVVDTTNDGFMYRGVQSDVKAGFFKFTEDKLLFVDALNKSQGSSKDDIIEGWGVDHTQTRLAESGGLVSNREEEDNTIPWYKKSSFKVDWNDSIVGIHGLIPYRMYGADNSCWSKISSNYVSEENDLGDDYINFTIKETYRQKLDCVNDLDRFANQKFNFSIFLKYSFRKLKPEEYLPSKMKGKDAYKPYVYDNSNYENDPLIKKYGFFKTYREYLNSDTGRIEVKTLMNRWNPNKTHTYYFTPDFPEEHKWIFNDPKIGIFAKTNKVFADRGLKIRFKIEDNDGSKKLGDIRYSFIHVETEREPAGILGYGPMDANPFTGEIIAANTSLWTGYFKFYLKLIYDQVSRDSENKNAKFYSGMEETLELAKSKWLSTTNQLRGNEQAYNNYLNLLPKFNYANPAWSRFTKTADQSFVTPKTSDSNNSKFNSIFSKVKDYLSPMFLNSNIQQNLDFHDEKFWNSYYAQESKLSKKTHLTKMENVLDDAVSLIKKGYKYEDIYNSMLYRLSIHEFGHNLSLRHNFFGSVDDKNHLTFKRNVKLKDGTTKLVNAKSTSSSVMEYSSFLDEVFVDQDWEAYDKAALLFAYSSDNKDKKIDLAKENNTKYLFCTDDDTTLNALCNRFDSGSTPTEVVMDIINSYVDGYWSRNLRYDRAYWNTSGYQSRVAGTMYTLKTFLAMWRSSMNDRSILQKLDEVGDFTNDEKSQIEDFITRDLVNANKLVVAFYNSVIQQKASDRPYRSVYNEQTGSLERMGIIADKVYAMQFLVDDTAYNYNPNQRVSYWTYLAHINNDEIGPVIDKVMENVNTIRPDMEPWFIGMGRSMFALNANNFVNMKNPNLLDRLKVECFSGDSFKKNFGIDPYAFVTAPGVPADKLQVALLDDTKYKSNRFFPIGSGRLGVMSDDTKDHFYVASEVHNKYTFNIMLNTQSQNYRFGNSLAQPRDDIRYMHYLYNTVKNMERECN